MINREDKIVIFSSCLYFPSIVIIMWYVLSPLIVSFHNSFWIDIGIMMGITIGGYIGTLCLLEYIIPDEPQHNTLEKV